MRIRRRRQRFSYFVLLLAIFVAVMVVCWLLCNKVVEVSDPTIETDDSVEIEGSGSSEEVRESDIDKAALKNTIKNWASVAQGEQGVVIYDLDHDEMLAEYNSDEDFGTASLYKLFVVYEGYQRISSREWTGDELVRGTGYNILECLDLSIRESYSPCAEGLWSKIGHQSLQKIVEDDWEIDGVNVEGLTSSPLGVLEIMKKFYSHDGISSEYVERMKDSFLNQPPTEYDWRQGLPAGFSRANVYDKVGWDYNVTSGYWNIYNDAAIVEIPEKNRHFVVVVMSKQSQYQDIRELGMILEDIFYSVED